MNHEEMRDSLWELASGELDAEFRRTLETHLQSCSGCAGEYARVRRARAVLFKQPSATNRNETELFVQRVMARLPQSPARSWLSWLDAPWTIPALSVGLAAACLSIVLSTPNVAPTDTLLLLNSQDRTIAQWILPSDSSTGGTLALFPENGQ